MQQRVTTALVLGLLAAGAARADDKADLKALLDRGIKALGGEEKLSKHKAATWKATGKVYFQGNAIDFKGDFAFQAPDKIASRVDLDFNGMQFQLVRVINGDKGWSKRPDGEVAELEGDALTREKGGLYEQLILMLLPLKGDQFKLEAAGEEKVNDKPAQGIKVTPKSGKEVKIYIDRETHLPVKIISKVRPPMSDDEVDQETVYSDFKEFNGIKRATKIVATRSGEKALELTISDYKPAEKVDAKLFEKP